MSLHSVYLDGTELSPAIVEYQVSITRGSGSVYGGPTASTCSLNIRTTDIADLIGFSVGAEIAVYVYGAIQRFVGTVSDLRIEHPRPGHDLARIQINAVGPVAALGTTYSQTEDWPEETAGARADRILGQRQVGVGNSITQSVVNVDTSQTVLARPLDPENTITLLQELCDSVGAAVFDDTAGRIQFQAHANRLNPWAAIIWQRATGTWATQGSATWDDATYDDISYAAPVQLAYGSVVWEPYWQQSLGSVVNDVTVTYGSPAATETSTEAPSVTAYGSRHAGVTTILSNAGDASDRAAKITATQAYPKWSLASAEIDMTGTLASDPALHEDILALRIGDRVSLKDLPDPSPLYTVEAVVEGYSETYTPDHHYLTFALSDPIASGLTATWASMPVGKTWATVTTGVRFVDVITPYDV